MGFVRAKASSGRIAEVLESSVDLIESKEQWQNDNFQGEIKFDGVSFEYPDTNVEVLKDISFQVEKGVIVTVLGATEASKSSLFQLIPRLYDVSSASVTIDDFNEKIMKLDYLRKHIGFVPQDARLFSSTIKDNICWGKEEATMDEIIDAAKAAEIHETIINEAVFTICDKINV
ncbi:hypothetical protein BKP37_17205 [Anaerobacillus alkalilacustris]|uniref:ABC transporter domain-containing protein n=2 Tax=Anaerobacillus alkalilacustris TaxID=393763 RepID=A0A1S2LE59_9BACI|nr:hypothetical protein BKP37_17205 [Anaerobacillus alkalilacustris]